MKTEKGFTLVELLVVITIIAILSVIGLTIFTGVQKSARDAKRRLDIDAIAKASEVHIGENPNNRYDTVNSSFFASGIVPKDPKNVTYIYSGSYNNTSPFDPALGYDNGGILPGDGSIRSSVRSADTFTICADLESDGVWDGTHQDYCRSNRNE